MTEQKTIPTLSPDYAAFVGLDWGDEKHALSLCAAGTNALERAALEQTPEALLVCEKPCIRAVPKMIHSMRTCSWSFYRSIVSICVPGSLTPYKPANWLCSMSSGATSWIIGPA